MSKYNGKMFLLGLGPVAVAFIELIRGNGFVNEIDLTIISADAPEPSILIDNPFKVIWHTFSKENLNATLAEFIPNNSIIVNCLSEVSSLDVMLFAVEKSCFYIDSSVENWQGEEAETHERQEEVYEKRALLDSGPPIIVNHGANPGLVSHFVKAALENACELKEGITRSDWKEMSYDLGIHSIHISEVDDQHPNINLVTGSFYSTWSVEAFRVECLETSIHAYGSEEPLGEGKLINLSDGYLAWAGSATGINTYSCSYSPCRGKYFGMVISHIETFTISRMLSKENDDGSLISRPSVLFCYRPCPASVWSLKQENWEKNKPNMLLKELCSGADEIGVSLFSNKEETIYWYGTTLSDEESRKTSPLSNATSVQVAAGLYGGLRAGLTLEKGGLYEPEDLDHQAVLKFAEPYLGYVRFQTASSVGIDAYSSQIEKSDPPLLIDPEKDRALTIVAASDAAKE